MVPGGEVPVHGNQSRGSDAPRDLCPNHFFEIGKFFSAVTARASGTQNEKTVSSTPSKDDVEKKNLSLLTHIKSFDS